MRHEWAIEARLDRDRFLRIRHNWDGTCYSELEFWLALTNSDHVARLIERVGSSRGDDVYKLRAQIGSRLHSLIKELGLTVNPDAQRFEDVFREGQVMILFVDPHNPTRFVQKVSGKTSILDLVKEDSELVKLSVDEAAEDGF